MKKFLNMLEVDKIKDFIKNNNLTKKQFAKLCGLSVSTLTRLMGKWTCGKLSSVHKICKAMKIELYEIWKDEPIENFVVKIEN